MLASHLRVICLGLSLVGLTLAQEPTTQPATQPATDEASTKPADKTQKVETGDIALVIQTTGTFEPLEPFEVRLRPEQYKGELKIVSAAPNGASIKAGDVLLQLDPADLQRDLAAVENDLVTIRANYDKAKADAELGEQADALALRMQQDILKNAEADLKWWDELSGPHMLKQADISLKYSTANVEDQQDELDQLKKMYGDEDLTSATADIVIKRALRQLEISKEHLEMTKANIDKTKTYDHAIARQKVVDVLDQARQQLTQLEVQQRHGKTIRQTAVKSAELALASAEKRTAELRQDLELLTIKAPSDGKLFYGGLLEGTWQNADPKALRAGEVLAAGQVWMTLATPGKLSVSIDVPEPKLAWVEAGMKATVTPLAFPDLKLTGAASVASPSGKGAAEQQNFKLHIAFAQPVDAKIDPGMKAKVRIDAGKLKNVPVLPLEAVSGGMVKIRGAQGEIEEREITVGRSDGKLVEIKAGLEVGDEVVLEEGK